MERVARILQSSLAWHHNPSQENLTALLSAVSSWAEQGDEAFTARDTGRTLLQEARRALQFIQPQLARRIEAHLHG